MKQAGDQFMNSTRIQNTRRDSNTASGFRLWCTEWVLHSDVITNTDCSHYSGEVQGAVTFAHRCGSLCLCIISSGYLCKLINLQKLRNHIFHTTHRDKHELRRRVLQGEAGLVFQLFGDF